MKKLLVLTLTLLCFLSLSDLTAQTNPWKFSSKISFPDPDSTVNPFLGETDDKGRLWVISTKANSVKAHNAIYYADPGDTVFTRFIDYDLNGDSDSLSGNVGATRGIAALNGSVYLSFTVPYPRYKPHTLSGMYRYDNGDTNNVFQKVASPSPTFGYGSFNHGIDITKDSIVVAGITFETSIRMYNWSQTHTNVAAFGTWIPPDPKNPAVFSNKQEPGGPQTAGVDLIRDIALVPGGDYMDPNTPVYSSRNSYSASQITGGIAVWQGGTQIKPGDYDVYRVEDFDGYLSFINPYPYGIDCDINKVLWVAGIDSTRRWAKGFTVDGVNAVALYDLPSSTSMDIPDPEGAPMAGPSDVIVNADASTAYVVDAYAKKIWVFTNTATDVKHSESKDLSFELEQNFPNPFNPSTMIRFTLNEGSDVKLSVTDVLGKEAASLVNGYLPAGVHVQNFNAADLSSGLYFYTLRAGNQVTSKKMLLIK